MKKKEKVSSPEKSHVGTSSIITWRKIVALAALTIFAYSSAINGGFIWDDDSYVTDNLTLRTPQGLVGIWTRLGATPQYYPLVFTTLWLEHHFWGLNPLGYHLVNVLLHIANVLLVWVILNRLGIPGAFWAASIFALHPVHVESVAWITELKNVLSGLCYLLSLLFYLKFLDGERQKNVRAWGQYFLALVFFVGALLSKTVTATLPAAILLLCWWREGRFSRRELRRLLIFFLLAGLAGSVTAWMEKYHVGAMGEEWFFSLPEKLIIGSTGAWFYFTKLLWPQPLIFMYPRWPINARLGEQYLFLMAFFAIIFWLWRRRNIWGRGPLTAILFFLGTLFPALGFFNVYPMRFSFVADHFQYLASLGVITLFSAVVCRAFEKKGWGAPRAQEYGFFGVLVLVCAVLTWQQGRAYQNVFTIFTDVIKKNPTSWMAYNNRGVEYLQRQMLAPAFSDFSKALQLKPDYVEALHNEGLVFAQQRKYDAALRRFNEAIEINPTFFMAYTNRAQVYDKLGKKSVALLDFNRALAINPYSELTYLRRGEYYAREKKEGLAMADFNRAIRIRPYKIEPYLDRALIYYQQKNWAAALGEYKQALALAPQVSLIYYGRAKVYEAMGQFEQALSELFTAQRLGYPVPTEDFNRLAPYILEESHGKV